MENKSTHWADIYADRIIREKGPKDVYTCASGITPSGTVHIGNFREIISVDLVVRALRDRGCNVRFIYSWDDYDVFRKVPKDMPEREKLETYLRKPITLVPDTKTGMENYARANEVAVEKLLPSVGISPEYIYQAKRYRKGTYAEGIRNALIHKEEIKVILNEFRSVPLSDDWWPVSVFSSFSEKDTTTILSWDGEWTLTYKDDEIGKTESIDIRTTPNTKLPWRIDWPMRWAFEGVDFEPAGKDHHSQGGSFDTSKRVVELFNSHAPVSFKYDFITLKGGGKQSSSAGNGDSLQGVLAFYVPEVVRYLFASTRPNAEFSISFDLDVLKVYEDYDSCERIYFGLVEVGDKKKEKMKRIYELSQVDRVPSEAGYQIPFRHLCNMLQIHEGNKDAVINSISDITDSQAERLRKRCDCAWYWLHNGDVPEDFKFSLTDDSKEKVELEGEFLEAVRNLKVAVEKMDSQTEKEFAQIMYDSAGDLDKSEFFRVVYNVLIGKDKGPKLAQFIKSCGKDKILPILERY
ncbi:MAG: lysine--tRNA ligase [Sphaerochaetaceae bacterium]